MILDPTAESSRAGMPLHALPIDAAELTDPDGDALTLTTTVRGLWLTCTTDGQEVTVGPFPAEQLTAALSRVGGVRGGVSRGAAA